MKPFIEKLPIKKLITLLLIITATLNYGNALWIGAKAELAQVLIEDAWEKTLESGTDHKPWSWSDTWPVARIHHPASGTDLYILAGIEGNSLAFGPGHHQETALPGEGASLIGGHRDTHFSFLKEAQLKDELLIQGKDGRWRPYEITTAAIKDSEKEPLFIDENSNMLYLVTCYPFDALKAGGPLRYLVTATPTTVDNQPTKTQTTNTMVATL